MRSNLPAELSPGDEENGSEDDPRFLTAFEEIANRVREGEFVDEGTLEREFPEFAEGLCRSLETMRLIARLAAPLRPHDCPSPSPLRDEFEGLRPIGRGGMGVVYEARQVSLGRRVALKFLPPEAAIDERHRGRFLREANAASMLDHEHIVPVVAIAATGPRPYYAMKFIEGHSLAAVIRGLRREGPGWGEGSAETVHPLANLIARLDADGFAPDIRRTLPSPSRVGSVAASPRLGRPYMDAVARLGVQAASALDHAHARGVIHGDVKPGNLLLDPRGHLWLTDFGLAILKDRDASRPPGHAGGTVGYMSPEQSSLEPLPIDHRTDLYSLGATLYELATLHRPPDPALAHPFTHTRPRRQNTAVPRDLETIILKALEPEVPRRYASAGAMAEDLGRFLRREPILARRASHGDRASKWAMRHRKGLAAWGATVVMLLVASVGFLAVANRREATQRLRAEAGHETLRALLLEATHAGEDLTEAVPPGSDRLHSYFDRMQRFYETAITRTPDLRDDPEYRHRVAVANHHLALSFSAREAAPMRRTIQHLDRSIALLGPLASDHPGRSWYRYNLFRSLSRRSVIHSWSNDRPRSESDARDALRVIEALSRDEPDKADWEDALAYQHFTLCQILRGQGRFEEAKPHALATLAIARRLAAAFPEKPLYLGNVHRAWSELAELARQAGHTVEEEELLREALEVHDVLSKSGPDQIHYPHERTVLQRRLGMSLTEAGRHGEARAVYEEALASADRLRVAFPYREDYQVSAFSLRRELANLHQLAGQGQIAEEIRREAKGEIERIVAKRPEFSGLRDIFGDPPAGPSEGLSRDARPDM